MSEYEDMKKKSKVTLTLADHNLNYNFIRGFDDLLERKTDLVNRVPIPSFPSYRKIFIKSRKWSHTPGANDTDVGFINLPVLKQITRRLNIFRYLKKEIKLYKNEKLIVVTYDVHLDQADAMIKIKKKFSNVTTCLIMPDIPIQILELGSPSIIQQMAAEQKMKYVSQMDSYVFLTEYMKEYVDVSGKYYSVVEGIYDLNSHKECKEIFIEKRKNNVILYSGNLRKQYGIEILIEAVKRLAIESENYELWICGKGEIENKIKAFSRDNAWFKYLGYITPPELYDVFAQATVLVNPRQNNMVYTRYSFPSKTLEYLASGKPVVAYKLDGIPDEYDEYINYIEEYGDAVTNLKNRISEVCSWSLDKRQLYGLKTKKFVIEKSPAKQCQKVIDMFCKMGL